MARIFSRRFSSALKWLLELDREDIGVYISGFLLVGAVIFSGYGEILTRILIYLYAGQMVYKGYRWIKPKRSIEKHTLDLRQNSHMKIARQKRSDQVNNDRFGNKH